MKTELLIGGQAQRVEIRGKRRAGQWGDRARDKRAKRLARAAERRGGFSRRGLFRGFPWRTLGEIYERTRVRIVGAHSRALAEAFTKEFCSDGVTFALTLNEATIDNPRFKAPLDRNERTYGPRKN
jgi:hypothetical protein